MNTDDRILYYNGKILYSNYTNSIIENIIKLSLKKGDVFELFPFNFFDNEHTDYKEKSKEYHCHLIIADIKITMVESWNGTIKTKIEVFLDG